MKKRVNSIIALVFIIALLLVISFVSALEIDSCQTLSSAGTYTLNQSVNSSGTCFIIGDDNVILDGAGFTINYSQSSIGYAINNTGEYENLTIKNSIIYTNQSYSYHIYSIGNNTDIQNNTLLTSDAAFNNALRIVGDGANITSNTITAYNGIYLSGSNFTISNNYIYTNDTSIDVYEGGLIQNNVIDLRASTGSAAIEIDYNNTVINNTITAIPSSSPALGIQLSGGGNNVTQNIINSSFSYVKYGPIYISRNGPGINYFYENVIIDNNQWELYGGDSGSDLNRTVLINQPIRNYSIGYIGMILSIENTTYGKIDFTSGVNGTGEVLYGYDGADILIGNNSVFVNSTSNPYLNESANITFYGIGDRNFSDPVVLKDGFTCTVCSNFTSLNASTIIFNVSSWSNYTIGERNDLPVESSVESSTNQVSDKGYPLFRSTEDGLKRGYNKKMYKNWKIAFGVGNETHTFKIEEISENGVDISISSERQEAKILSGEEKKFELTGDDYYDLLVKVNSVNSSSFYANANITLKAINEEISYSNDSVRDDFKEADDILQKDEWKIILLIMLIVFGVIGFYFYNKWNHI